MVYSTWYFNIYITTGLFVACLREVQKSIQHSVKKLLEDQIVLLKLSDYYKITNTVIESKINNSKIIFNGLHDYNSDNIKALEGVDICWIEEAQSISRKSIDVLRPTIRKDNSFLIWNFNPTYETDPVWIDYIRNKDPEAEVLWLSWRDNPWFNDALRKQKDADYLRDHENAEHIWEGKLRSTDDRFVFSSMLVDDAVKRELDEEYGFYTIGADIAHQGGDEIVFYKKRGNRIVDTYIKKKQNVKETTIDLMDFVIYKDIPINIDNGHVGAAVADLLEDRGYTVNRVNFGGAPKDKEHYQDVVTEMYFELREKLKYSRIPKDNELSGQLTQRRYMYLKSQRGYEVMKIESKQDFREHAEGINKSPDRADALALAFYEPEKTSYGFSSDIDVI